MLDGTYHIECACNSFDHTARYTLDKQDECIYVEIRTHEGKLFHRLWEAFKGPDSAEIIITKEQAVKLQEMLNDFLGVKNCWKNGIPQTESEIKDIQLLHEAGCKCELPLLGSRMSSDGKVLGPRCRLCNTEAKNAG